MNNRAYQLVQELLSTANTFVLSEDGDKFNIEIELSGQEKIKTIQQLIKNDNQHNVDIVSGKLNLGENITVCIYPNRNGEVYPSYYDFLDDIIGKKVDLSQITIYEHLWREQSQSHQPLSIDFLQLGLDLANAFKNTFNWNAKLALSFKNQLVELVLKGKQLKKIVDIMPSLSGTEQQKAMRNLITFLSVENDNHFVEKKAIVSSVIGEKYSKDAKVLFSAVLIDIVNCSQEIEGKFQLYTENFNYSDFVEKLADNSEKFLEKINSSLEKLQTQVIALPIITTFITLFRVSNNNQNFMSSKESIILWISLITLCVIVGINIFSQFKLLLHTRKKIKLFDKEKRMPTSLIESGSWQYDKAFLLGRIKTQLALLTIFSLITLSVLLFSVDEVYGLKQIYDDLSSFFKNIFC